MIRSTNTVCAFALLVLLSIASVAPGGVEAPEPRAIVLTWQQDPTTTMTIDWHTVDGEIGDITLIDVTGHQDLPVTHPVVAQPPEAELAYRPAAGGGEWQSVSAETQPYPFIEERLDNMHRDGYSHPLPPQGRSIHRVELTGLEPGTLYEFRLHDADEVHRFRTMPRSLDERELRIAMGGDVGYGVWTERMHQLAASYDPDFVVWGGDIAYADGLQERLGRWYDFFDSKTRTLVAEGNRRIPVLVALGNHEVQGGYWDRSERVTGEPYTEDDATRQRLAPYFFSFFAFPGQPGYDVLDFGDYLSIVLLDSGHANPIDGTQTEWLDDVLEQRADVPHVFPAYHVPAFPSFRSLDDPRVVAINEHWVPLFERHRLSVVYENHDHNYKRTPPIRDGEPHPEGVTYIGDGCWGVLVTGVQEEDEQRQWFLEQAEPVSHFILVTLEGEEVQSTAIDIRGETIDEHRTRRPGF